MTTPLFEVSSGPPAQRGKSAARNEQDFVDQVIYWLTAPCLAWPGWESIWEANDNRTKATLLRLAHHKEIWDTQQCTEFEAMLYISTATMENPPNHSWTQVYFWLFRREFPNQADDVLGDSAKQELDVSQKEMLSRLRNWIFRQQLNHMKSKLRGETKALKNERRALEAEQARLF